MEFIIISVYSIEMNFYLFFIYFVVLSSASVMDRDNLGEMGLFWSSLIGWTVQLEPFLVRSYRLGKPAPQDLGRRVRRAHRHEGMWAGIHGHEHCCQLIVDLPNRLWIPEGSIWSVDACFWKFQNDTSWIENKLLSWYLLTFVVK